MSVIAAGNIYIDSMIALLCEHIWCTTLVSSLCTVYSAVQCVQSRVTTMFSFLPPPPPPHVSRVSRNPHPSVTRRPPELRVWSEWVSVKINQTQWGRDVNNMKLLWKLWRRCERPNSRSSLFIDSQITKTKWYTENKYHRDIHIMFKKRRKHL